jgi:hypothetical protein
MISALWIFERSRRLHRPFRFARMGRILINS